jgi:hypothetical protein
MSVACSSLLLWETNDWTLTLYNSNHSGAHKTATEFLDQRRQTEWLKEARCSRCSRRGLSKTWIGISSLPEHLIICLSRGESTSSKSGSTVPSKSTSPASPELEFDIAPYSIADLASTQSLYTLHNVVKHKSSILQEGHYIAYTYRNGEVWRCNDEDITGSSWAKALRNDDRFDVYMAFYRKLHSSKQSGRGQESIVRPVISNTFELLAAEKPKQVPKSSRNTTQVASGMILLDALENTFGPPKKTYTRCRSKIPSSGTGREEATKKEVQGERHEDVNRGEHGEPQRQLTGRGSPSSNGGTMVDIDVAVLNIALTYRHCLFVLFPRQV